MKTLLFLLSLVAFASCATRTPYQPHDDYLGGYSEDLSGDLKLARFVGNAHTFKSDAQIYSQLRAMELCKENNKSIALVLEQFDLSQSQQVHRSSSTGSFVGKTYYGSTHSWTQTYTYPTFDTYFVCTDKAYSVGANLHEVSKDDMKILVKDLKGAVQVLSLRKGSPNLGILREGDIIVKMNDERVEYIAEIKLGLERALSKNAIPVVIYREGELIKLNVRSAEVTDSVISGQNDIAKAACGVSEISDRAICVGRNIASDGTKDSKACTFADKLNAKHGCALFKISN